MKFKKYLFTVMLLITAYNTYSIIHDGVNLGPCSAHRCEATQMPCECWCASCGGYRLKHDGSLGTDNPQFSGGICYCNPRDVGTCPYAQGGSNHHREISRKPYRASQKHRYHGRNN